MHVYELNKPIFQFAPDHPARQFLEAFVECRRTCVGRELDGVDQEWVSGVDGGTHRFSSFAYEWLSFDIELDGWLQQAPGITESEKRMLEAIPRIERFATECKAVAVADNNLEVIAMCDQVFRTTKLWTECIKRRLPLK